VLTPCVTLVLVDVYLSFSDSNMLFQDVSILCASSSYTSIVMYPPCSADEVDATSESLSFRCLSPLLFTDIFKNRFLFSAISEQRLVLICIMSRLMPRMSSVSFVNEHVTVLTSSSSFYCYILKASSSRSISSIFLFELLRPDIVPC
jgi:hypothetical protein